MAKFDGRSRRGKHCYAPSLFGSNLLLSLGEADILESVGDGFEGAAMSWGDEMVVTSSTVNRPSEEGVGRSFEPNTPVIMACKLPRAGSTQRVSLDDMTTCLTVRVRWEYSRMMNAQRRGQ